MKLLPALILALTLPATHSLAVTSEASFEDCRPEANDLYRALEQTWIAARQEPRSYAKDTVFSAYDYAKAYNAIMVRTPYRQDWTKGVYLAMKDKMYYAWRYGSRQPWTNPDVYYWLDRSRRALEVLGYCYR